VPAPTLEDVAAQSRQDHGRGWPDLAQDHLAGGVGDMLGHLGITGKIETMLSLAAPGKTSRGITEIPTSGIVTCAGIVGHARQPVMVWINPLLHDTDTAQLVWDRRDRAGGDCPPPPHR